MLLSSCLTYGVITLVMPMSYTSTLSQDLTKKAEEVVEQLEQSTLENCGDLLTRFARENDAEISIFDAEQNEVGNTFSGSFRLLSEGSGASPADRDDRLEEDTSSTIPEEAENVTQALCFSFSFSNSTAPYQIAIVGSMRAINQAVEALQRIWPWLVGIILLISVLSSMFYTRYIARPIVRMSQISEKLSGLDFNWRCQEQRTDEIGVLAHSLNGLAEKLSATIAELQQANEALRADIDYERELERQRLEFFSAVSHELKTPITIIEGQLGGMLDGIGVYADRDTYLARSLAVARQMEGMVQELLEVSRIETAVTSTSMEPLDLRAIIISCVESYTDLFEQRNQRLHLDLADDTWINGNPDMLTKAIRNVLTNAALYSPNGAAISISSFVVGTDVVVTTENMCAHIPEETLPHLFEAFYRVDSSRNRQTGGSGLGLYLVKTILEKHGATCEIFNSKEGVCLTMRFHRHTPKPTSGQVVPKQ